MPQKKQLLNNPSSCKANSNAKPFLEKPVSTLIHTISICVIWVYVIQIDEKVDQTNLFS